MKYVIGLDLGTTSVGWAVINKDESRIEDLGVRLFESAENPKDGHSLAEPRRLARGARRRLARRRSRLDKIKAVFILHGLLTASAVDSLLLAKNNPYQIRSEALDKKISNNHLFLAIYHLAKRRGYKSNRKSAELEAVDSEKKAVLSNIFQNSKRMRDTASRTVGEMLYKELLASAVSFEGVRNKPSNYKHSVSRSMLQDELELIIKTQQKFSNELLTESFYNDLVGIDKNNNAIGAFNYQRHYAQGDILKQMVGFCTFEKDEIRAAKATYSFQYFNILQRLNNLLLIDSNGDRRPLTKIEKEQIIAKLLIVKTCNYQQVKKLLGLENTTRFNMVNYFVSRKQLEKKSEAEQKDDCEAKTKLPNFEPYHVLKSAVIGSKDKPLNQDFWKVMSSDTETLDELAEILTLYKTDEDILKYLDELRVSETTPLPDDVKKALLAVSFIKFGHLSVKALRKIIPHLEDGKQYDEAVTLADKDYGKNLQSKKLKLSPISKDDCSVTNPVVRRTVSQTIKVVNAIIDRYGSPYEVHIELGRELSKNHKERNTLLKDQKLNREKNEQAVTHIKDNFKQIDPKGEDIIKHKLWYEQNCKCAYSGKSIDDTRLFETGYTEIDHIIPFSRSFNDSFNNKVLVLIYENQNKGNKIPYEFLATSEQRWAEFEALVTSMRLISKSKRENLLSKKYVGDKLTERTLNDTRYIARYIKNYIENNLIFTKEENKRTVVSVNGLATAYIRKRWGLTKDREASSLHHAQDAAIVATITPAFIQKISTFSKLRYIQNYLNAHKDASGVDATVEEIEEARKMIDKHEAGSKIFFPEPWDNFRSELIARMSADPMYEIGLLKKELPNYSTEIKPIFISHMPKHKVTGRAHADTLRSPKRFSENMSSVKTPLISLTEKKLRDGGHYLDPKLYKELLNQLNLHCDDAKKAFAEPFYKRMNNGKQGPLVRSVKLFNYAQKSGILLNNGTALADQDSMVRIDIFSKQNNRGKNEFFFIPIYAYHTTQKILPNKFVISSKQENDWGEIDDTFSFMFSLYPGDLFELTRGEKNEMLYYSGANRANASISGLKHDKSKQVENLGIKTLDKLDKYVVDMLGKKSLVIKESRQSFNS